MTKTTKYQDPKFLLLKQTAKELAQEPSESIFFEMQKLCIAIFRTDQFAYTSSSAYPAFWYNENSNNKNARHIFKEEKKLRAFILIDDGYAAVYKDSKENEYVYKLV